MTTLSENKPRSIELGLENDIPVIAADIIYEGAFVGDNGSGYARPLQAGDPFLGIAREKVDNSTGSAGDKNVRLLTDFKVQMSVTGATAITDRGAPVYASDDDTLTLTAGSNTLVGFIERYVSGTNCVVRCKANQGNEAVLTDNSGGTASDTIAAISDTATKNAVASIAAKVNYLLSLQRD